MMSKLLLFGLCTLTLACRSKAIEIDGEEQSILPDNDFDGYNSDVDCDDFDGVAARFLTY